MRALLARVGDAGTARFHPVLPGRLDGDDPERREAQQAEAGLGIVLAGDKEDRFGDAPADRLILLEMPPPAQRGQHRVVEGGGPVEIADLQEDVVKHQAAEAIGVTRGMSAPPINTAAGARDLSPLSPNPQAPPPPHQLPRSRQAYRCGLRNQWA